MDLLVREIRNVLSSAKNLKELHKGYWEEVHRANVVSYPESHHALLLETQESSFWYNHRKNCLKYLILKSKPKWLLDIGSSNGLMAKYLSEFVKTVPLEPHYEGARNAFLMGLSPVIQASFNNAYFENNSVPAIGLFDVLEHIEYPEAFLRNLIDCLIPGGEIYITVPAYQSLWSIFDERVGHYRRYTEKSLTDVLNDSGFKINYFTYIFSPLPIPIWYKRVLRKRVNRTDKDHYSSNQFVTQLMKILLYPELLMVKQFNSIPFGSSCLCVASKPMINE